MTRKHPINVLHWTAISTLIGDLGSRHWLKRSRAAEAIGNCGRDAAPAVPALRDALGDPHREVRRDAVIAFGKLGELAVPAIGDLIALLDDREVQWEAHQALVGIGVPAVAPLIRELANEQRANRIQHILHTIGMPAVDKLLDDLECSNEAVVRTGIMWVLSPSGCQATHRSQVATLRYLRVMAMADQHIVVLIVKQSQELIWDTLIATCYQKDNKARAGSCDADLHRNVYNQRSTTDAGLKAAGVRGDEQAQKRQGLEYPT